MAIDNELIYQYIDETGQNYTIKLAQSTATILGISNVNKGTYPVWPYGHKNLRHVTGRDNTGLVRRRLTITDPANAIFNTTVGVVTWTDKEGNTIIREGVFGGKRPGTK